MGGTKSEICNFKGREIWLLADKNNIWLLAVHVPGVDNIIADKESRLKRDETEWMLNRNT